MGRWKKWRPASRAPHARALQGLAKLLLLCVYCCLSCLAPPDARAASSMDVLDRERGREIPAPRARPGIHITDEGTVRGISRETPFLLRSLRISGATAFPEDELLAPYRDLVGKETTFSALAAVATELTKKYRSAGYLLSRFIIPKQEVDPGGADIRLHCIEGYIEAVRYNGEGGFKERFREYFAPAERRIVGVKPLRYKDLERYMLLAQDLPGVSVSSLLKKGEQPGGSILVIEVTNQYVEADISYGNTGTESAGPFTGSVTLAVNNVPAVGAQSAVSYAQANNYKEYWTVTASERYRMWNGLEFSFLYAHSDSPEMDTEFAREFDYRSTSDTFTVGLSYPIIRSREFNLSAGLGYEHRNSDSFILDERFTRDRLRTLSGTLDFDWSDSLGGVTQLIATLSHGVNILDATDRSSRASNSLAPAEFWKIDLYGSRDQQLPGNFSLFTAAEAQFANKSLSSYNKFFLGGSRFGRGYDPGIVDGDNGFAFSVEPRWTCLLGEKTTLQVFGFVDWGTVWSSQSAWRTPSQQVASSAGGGLRLWGKTGSPALPDFNVSAFVGQPLQQIRGDSSHYGTRFVFQVGLHF